MSDSLPHITEYFNTIIYPRQPHLGKFSPDLSNPGKVICPFHDDINPSLGIIPGTEVFHCFGCGAHGNLVEMHRQFINEFLHKNLTIDEARSDLLDMYGLSDDVLPSKQDRIQQLLGAASKSEGSFKKDIERASTVDEWSSAVLKAVIG